jgi:hypothetical protein
MPPGVSQGYSAYFEPSQPSVARADGSVDRLVLSGINRFQILGTRMREFERELQGIGVDSVDELMRRYGLGGSEETTFEIVTGPLAKFDREPRVDGRHIAIGFQLAAGLQNGLFRIVVRNADTNAVCVPRTLSGENVKWSGDGGQEGTWEFDLPHSQVLDCRLVYAGRVQAQVRVADPATLPNPRWMMAALVDPELRRLKDLLTTPGKKQGRDFEAGVAWLFQLLGFAPIHIGAMSDLTDEPDILVTSPSDDVLIVECTTGIPQDKKLTMLVSRAAHAPRLAKIHGLQVGRRHPGARCAASASRTRWHSRKSTTALCCHTLRARSSSRDRTLKIRTGSKGDASAMANFGHTQFLTGN